jgi:hypothetical protein
MVFQNDRLLKQRAGRHGGRRQSHMPPSTEGMHVIRSDTTYTGRMEFDLVGRSVAMATVDVVVRLDLVEFSIGRRTMARVGRAELREWLTRPIGFFEVDDLAFFVANGRICLTVDGSVPYAIAEVFITDLVRVL